MTRDLQFLHKAMTDQQRVIESVRSELDKGERARYILEQAVNAISLGLTIVDMDGKILYVNKADAVMHGFEPGELVGRSALVYAGIEVATAEPRPPILRKWSRESVNQRKDGTRFPVRLISEPILDRDGSPIGLLTVCEDLSEKDAAERLKEDFLATVSHELRTPLTSIVACVHLLEFEGLDEERVPELLDMTKRNSERLLRLIGDLLDLQKLRARKMTFRIAPVDAVAAVESVLAEIGVLAERRGLAIELTGRVEGLRVLADPQRLHQVLVNLLSNAVKFSPAGAGARIGVAIKQEKLGVGIAVSDEGPGIPEDRLDNLFEPFSRLGSTSAATQPGSGLGLAIVKRLLEGMNGTITVDTSVGVGTTVRILLPAEKAG